MNHLLKIALLAITTLSLLHPAHADEFAAMMYENQQGKIAAAQVQMKRGIIAEMMDIEKEMMRLQDRIDEDSDGDSHGDLRDAGQMIDIVHNTIVDAQKLDADTEYARLQDALAGVQELRNQVKSLLKK